MLITLISKGRAAAEVAKSLRRLELRLCGADRQSPVLTCVHDVQSRSDLPGNDLITFAALRLRDVCHPAVIESSTIVVAVCEGDHADRQALVESAIAAGQAGKARVVVLGTGVHHAEVTALPLRVFPLSPDETSCRILYAALLREASAIETGSPTADPMLRRIVARRMLRLSEQLSSSHVALVPRELPCDRMGRRTTRVSITAPRATRGGLR